MRILLPALALLAACSTTHVSFERHPSMREARWSLEFGPTAVDVRAEGADTLVSWRGRTLRFPGYDSFRGTIRTRGVDLTGPRLAVRVRDDGVTVTEGNHDRFQSLSTLPEGRTSVWRDGRFAAEGT